MGRAGAEPEGSTRAARGRSRALSGCFCPMGRGVHRVKERRVGADRPCEVRQAHAPPVLSRYGVGRGRGWFGETGGARTG